MGLIECPAASCNFVGKNIAMKGKLMYQRDDILQFVKMPEAGLFPKGKEFADAKSFESERWKAGKKLLMQRRSTTALGCW
jgi:hypothetical protein